MNLTLRELETCLLGDSYIPEDGDTAISSIRTDSRVVGPGDVFFCLEGENFDGHNFAGQAAGRGAAAIVSSRLLDETPGTAVIMVRDTLAALGKLAGCMRDKSKARFLAVTGTAGKTTVKETLASCLERKFRVARNHKNWNNQIGLPLSIFAANGDEDFWVMELGISLPGDMDELGSVARPDVGVVLNIGPAHLEGLGDLQGVARAKASMLKYLREDGVGLVNMDYPMLLEEAEKILPGVKVFSARDESAEYFCGFTGIDEKGLGLFRIKTPDMDRRTALPVHGAHWAENIAAIAAAAHVLGLPPDDLLEGLKDIPEQNQRFACKKMGKWLVIDDTYNANPLSMTRAIETAAFMAGDRPLVLVLGDMKELGSQAGRAHLELGEKIREASPAKVFFQGEYAPQVAQGMGEKPVEVNSAGEFAAYWKDTGLEPGIVLIKGSRSCAMEKYVAALFSEAGVTG